jgi:hypothetical protein
MKLLPKHACVYYTDPTEHIPKKISPGLREDILRGKRKHNQNETREQLEL